VVRDGSRIHRQKRLISSATQTCGAASPSLQPGPGCTAESGQENATEHSGTERHPRHQQPIKEKQDRDDPGQ